MNRAPIILGIALLIAALAPGRADMAATAAPVEQTTAVQQQAQTTPVSDDEQWLVGTGVMNDFTYSLTFSQPNSLTGDLTSAQSYPNQWDGAVIDRTGTAQAIEQTGTWDSLPEATKITLTTPGKDIEHVEVIFDPNTLYDTKTGQPLTEFSTYSVQSVSMIPSQDGTVDCCAFPISFLSPDGQQDYDQVFCIIRLTFRDGDSCDIACALTRQA